jgi:peptide deformylase
MPLKIIKYPSTLLRKKTRKIKDFKNPEIAKLVSSMKEAMEESKGIGLAATQVGSDMRVCVIEVNDDFLAMINPEIKSHSRKKVVAEEGCLSFPGKFLEIERYEKVKVRAMDLSGQKLKIKAEGLLARVIQHEIDHLDGVLMIDRAKVNKK